MACVYKARMKYSVPIGIVSLILYTVLGFSTTSVSETATMQIGNEYAMNLVYIILPILVVVLMLKGMNLLTSLLYADILGIIMLFVLEGLSLAEAFSSKGVVVNSIKDVIGGTFLIMFGFIVTSITRVTGVLDEIVNVIGKHAKDARSGEVLIGVTQCAFTLVTGSPSASVAIVDPMARQFVKPYHIDRTRIANIMNGLAGGIGGMVPHCSTGAMAVSLAISLGATANPNFSTFDCVGYNFYSIGLLLMFWAAILTGWGREFEPNTDEEESL